MSKLDKNLEELFDISPTPPAIVENKKENLPVVKSENSDMKQDLDDAYDQTKSNLQEFIDQGKDALDEILQIAKAGQHPRAFEVYGTLLKNMIEANDRLLKIQKEMRELDGTLKQDSPKTNIDKAIFVGSTTDLQKFLKDGSK